ncbi:MAG: SRPBCC domain-containing protein [Chitinophagales bacterium]
MQNQDLQIKLIVSAKPEAVFQAINNVRGWWSEEITGSTVQLNDKFNYNFEDVHRCEIKIITSIPNKIVEWYIKNNYFKFTKDKTEWTGTTIRFEIIANENNTEVIFTHLGLTDQLECFEICSGAWSQYILTSLKHLIETGTGNPNGKGNPQTEDESKFLNNN